MSKLMMGFTLLFSTIIYHVVVLQAQDKALNIETETTHVESLELSEETRLWGKATGPVQLRIDFKEQSGDNVTLVASIRSSVPQLKIEWVLPQGVDLVSGQRQETLSQTEDLKIYQKEITVKVQWPLQKPHLVLRAVTTTNGKPQGASTVFNLDPSLHDMEKEEIIKAHIQSRKIHKLVK